MHTQDTSQQLSHIRSRLKTGRGSLRRGRPGAIGDGGDTGPGAGDLRPIWSQAVNFAETPAMRDIARSRKRPSKWRSFEEHYQAKEKNEMNTKRIKPLYPLSHVLGFIDRAINNYKHPGTLCGDPPDCELRRA